MKNSKKQLLDEFANTEEILEGKEIESFLLKLPKSYYIILSLKYDDGYTNKEIADILNITEENVNKRLYRARNKLREILTKQEVEL